MLIHHPESDALFWDANFTFEGMDGGLCNDVTNQQWALDRAKAEGIKMDIRTKLNREQMAKVVADLVQPAIIDAIVNATRTCITCDSWEPGKELCNRFQKRPPAKVIAFGCPAYENEIPF